MRQFHLYKLNKIYLYVLQTLNNKNNMDILAIRSDAPYIIFPMYSPTFKKYEDLGIPSVDTLRSIDRYFLTCVQVSQLVCGDMFSLTNNSIKEYIREHILQMNVADRPSRDIELLAMSINRSQSLNMEGLRKYVANRIYNSNASEVYKKD